MFKSVFTLKDFAFSQDLDPHRLIKSMETQVHKRVGDHPRGIWTLRRVAIQGHDLLSYLPEFIAETGNG